MPITVHIYSPHDNVLNTLVEHVCSVSHYVMMGYCRNAHIDMSQVYKDPYGRLPALQNIIFIWINIACIFMAYLPLQFIVRRAVLD